MTLMQSVSCMSQTREGSSDLQTSPWHLAKPGHATTVEQPLLPGLWYHRGLDHAGGQAQAPHVLGNLAHARHPDVAVLQRP
jgi:hypothetical protein